MPVTLLITAGMFLLASLPTFLVLRERGIADAAGDHRLAGAYRRLWRSIGRAREQFLQVRPALPYQGVALSQQGRVIGAIRQLGRDGLKLLLVLFLVAEVIVEQFVFQTALDPHGLGDASFVGAQLEPLILADQELKIGLVGEQDVVQARIVTRGIGENHASVRVHFRRVDAKRLRQVETE